jgi:predicted metal-dependent peptidase
VRALTMQMIEHHPFWGYLLLQMQVVFDASLPTYAATDCLRYIWLNPQRTGALSLRQLGFVLVHELAHQLQLTTARAKGRDAMCWHRATDYAINRIVTQIPHPSGAGPLYTPVDGALIDRTFGKLTAEGIYERLWRDPARRAPASRGARGTGDSETESLMVAGHRVVDHGGGVDVHLPVPFEAAIEEELAERILEAVAHSDLQQVRGDVPGEARRLVELRTPRVPWRRVLRQFVNASLTRDEYDPRRPNRRWLSEGFVVPGLSGERVQLVVVALDTSGSMTADQLSEACAEIRMIACEVADLRLVVADAAVQEVVALDDLETWFGHRRAAGGGGTDHRPVFAWIQEQRLHPDLFVGLTDLESQFPEQAPGYPVLWVTPRRHGTAPWGHVVEVG